MTIRPTANGAMIPGTSTRIPPVSCGDRVVSRTFPAVGGRGQHSRAVIDGGVGIRVGPPRERPTA
jgi:hypothetical protein